MDHSSLAKAGSDVEYNGKTVVFPTDTVYGLGANPLLEEGVRSCLALKRRDETKPMPVLFSDISTVKRFVEFDSSSESLARKFWPGGVTLVLKIKKEVTLPSNLARNESLAVRIPDNECCLELIRSCGGSLIGTSANRSGQPPFTYAYDTELEAFAYNCDYLVRGECSGKVPSTVISIDLEGRLKVLRDGAVPISEINRYLGKTRIADFS